MTAVVFFALAAAVALRSPPEWELRRLQPRVRHRGRRTVLRVMLAGVVVVLVFALVGPRAAGWVVAAGVVMSTALWVVGRMREDRRRSMEKGTSARAARTLALLLQAGQIPTHALDDAATDCPVLAPAALTGRLGGDIAAALHDTGRVPGREGLTRVAAAWRVSESTGAPVAAVLTRVAENLRKERHLGGVVAAELATARASGRIMALLPFVAVAVGMLVGADPISFLFGSWIGELMFLAGTVLAAIGVVWTERIARPGVHVGRGGQ